MYELAHFLLYIKNSAVRGYNRAVLQYIQYQGGGVYNRSQPHRHELRFVSTDN